MEIDPIDGFIALLQRYNPQEPLTEEVEKAASKVASFLKSKAINPGKGTTPLPLDRLRIAQLTPLLESVVRKGLEKETHSQVIEFFDALLSIVRVAGAASTIFHHKNDIKALTTAVDELEKQILNPDFIQESHTCLSKKNLLRSTQVLGIALGKHLKGITDYGETYHLYKKIAFLKQLIATLLVEEEIFCLNAYYSPALLYQIKNTHPNYDFSHLSARDIGEFAQEALFSQQYKFILVRQQACWDDLRTISTYTVFFTNREPCTVYLKDNQWVAYDYVEKGEKVERRILKTALTVEEILEEVCKGYKGVNLPYSTTATVVTPLFTRLKASFDERTSLPKEIDQTLMLQVIDRCKRRGALTCLWHPEILSAFEYRKIRLAGLKETSLLLNFFVDLKYAANYEKSILIDPAYHGSAIVIEAYLSSPQVFAERNRFGKEDLQNYAARHLTQPRTFLALPDFFVPGCLYLFLRHEADKLEIRHFKLNRFNRSDLTLNERFDLKEWHWVCPDYDRLQHKQVPVLSQ